VIWLVLRRGRTARRFALGLVAAAAVALVVLRLRAPEWATEEVMAGCTGRARVACPGEDAIDLWLFGGQTMLVVLALWVLPSVVGIAVGAGLFGREFDHGTQDFAWTQGIGRLRWFGTGLLVAGLPVVLAVGLLGALAGWALEPVRAVFRTGSWLDPVLFGLTGLVPALSALLAFSLAAVAGLLLRGGLAAVAVAAVLCVTVQLGVGALRADYAEPETATSSAQVFYPEQPRGAWVVDEGHVDAHGLLVPGDLDRCAYGSRQDESSCLYFAGVTDRYTSYHPAERYWPFQLAESAILLGVVAVSVLGCVAGLRRVGARTR
jgi:hypothetical protein